MSNNNHKTSACDFAESLISYLYDEIGTAEKWDFEEHLKDCAACRDELAAVGFARTAIREWRADEFDALATPRFAIPLTVRSVETPAVTPESRSWFDGWRQIFTLKPALALSVSMILIALFGATFLLFNAENDDRIAGGIVNRQEINAAVSPTGERKIELSKETIDDQAAPPLKAISSKPVDKNASAAPKTSTVKVSSGTSKNNSKVVSEPTKINQKTRRDVRLPANASKNRVPNLTETADEEDDAIRLADLFDEIETR